MTSPRSAETAGPPVSDVVNRYLNLLLKIGREHRLSEVDLDELVQDVRVRLWKSGRSEKKEPISASYMYRVGRSAAIDMIRRRRRSREHLDLAEAPAAHLALSTDPEQDLDASELVEALELSIREIPESRQAVVRMYLRGHHRHEISSLMGWSEAKTRNLLYRGLEDVRRRLSERIATDDNS